MVTEGEDALLTCVVRNLDTNTLLWKREESDRRTARILTAGPNRVIQDNRFNILHDSGNNFIPFLGYDFIAIPGDSFLKMKASLDFEIAPKNHLIVAANIAKVTDDILRPGSFKRAPSYFGYGLGYGFESILGPAQLMYTKSPLNGPGAVFFTLGFPF